MSDQDGETIRELSDGPVELSAEGKEHIIGRHFRDEMPGSRFTEPWERIRDLTAESLPEAIIYDEAGEFHFQLQADRAIGLTGVDQREHLRAAGLISDQAAVALEQEELEIFVRNILDSEQEKDHYVAEFNLRYADDRFALVVRANSICALVTAELQETDRLVAILHQDRAADGDRHRLMTMFPGPDMPRLPGDPLFTGTAESWAKIADGQAVPEDADRLSRQVEANFAWAEAAFIAPEAS